MLLKRKITLKRLEEILPTIVRNNVGTIKIKYLVKDDFIHITFFIGINEYEVVDVFFNDENKIEKMSRRFHHYLNELGLNFIEEIFFKG